MEHYISYHKQLGKKYQLGLYWTKFGMSEADIDENDEKTDEKARKTNWIKKAIRTRRQEDPERRTLWWRVIQLKSLKTEIGNNIDVLRQTIWHIGEAKALVILKNKDLKYKNQNFPSQHTFAFTDFVELQKEENEIDLGLFFELAEENKIIYNQVPEDTLMEDMEIFKNCFCYEWSFYSRWRWRDRN